MLKGVTELTLPPLQYANTIDLEMKSIKEI